MARDTKLDDLRSKRICDALRQGHSYATAARAGGISEASLYAWLERGRQGEQPYLEFLEKFDRADHEAEERAVRVLISKFDSDDDRVAMQAAQWWLTRRRAAQWGDQKVDATPPSEEECKALISKIRGTGT